MNTDIFYKLLDFQKEIKDKISDHKDNLIKIILDETTDPNTKVDNIMIFFLKIQLEKDNNSTEDEIQTMLIDMAFNEAVMYSNLFVKIKEPLIIYQNTISSIINIIRTSNEPDGTKINTIMKLLI